ncbi:SRPBCC family protein [Streptomyces canus]|uniref:SRPBCC family protein n=1 Tax=Streptomyces canus TaxID=58343 RepID=UPI0037FA14F0
MREATLVSSIEIAARPTTVYGILTDLSRWGQFVAETRVPARAAAVRLSPGTSFHAWNRNGLWRWRTTTTVLEAVPHDRLVFRVSCLGGPVSVWRYDIVPTPRGSRVTESTRDLRGRAMVLLSIVTTGVVDRAERNRRNIDLTLAGLKSEAEAEQQT